MENTNKPIRDERGPVGGWRARLLDIFGMVERTAPRDRSRRAALRGPGYTVAVKTRAQRKRSRVIARASRQRNRRIAA